MSKKKIGKKAKQRIFLAFLFFGFIISILSYKLFENIEKTTEMKKQKEELRNRIVELQEEESKLEIDIQKLGDPTYIARYAREKYLYSKDGEIIIRIEE